MPKTHPKFINGKRVVSTESINNTPNENADAIRGDPVVLKLNRDIVLLTRRLAQLTQTVDALQNEVRDLKNRIHRS